MKLTRRDRVVTVILVLLILVLLYMLQCHWRNRFGSHGEAKPVGEVEYKYHQVQRKYSDRMLWEDVESKTPVYPYDWVMTKDKSDARITLKGGMKVEMDPESMVEIDETRDGVGLTLRDGTIRADTRDSKNGTISAADGTKIDLTKGNAQISTDGKNLSVDVKEGKATIKNRDKESKLSAGEVGSVDPAGIRKEKTSIVLQSPSQDFVLEDASRPVEFAFEAGQGARDCAIALSSGGKKKRTIRVAGYRHSEKLGDGTYQWRVSCVLKGQKISSATGAFRVRPVRNFMLLSPAPGQSVAAAKGEGVPLRWKSSRRVRVEVSMQPDFSKLVKGEESSGQAATFESPAPGKYYWRVYPAGDKSQSIQSSFTVTAKDQKVATAGPPDKQGNPPGENTQKDPANPNNGQQKPASEPQKLTARAPGQVTIEPDETKTAVRISWNPAGKEWSYRVRVSDSRDFSDPLVTRNISGKGQTTVLLKPGEYYYRVDIRPASGGRPIAATTPQRISITRKKLPAPPRVKSVQAD